MLPEDKERFLHMLDAAREAVTFAAGHIRSDLDTDRGLALILIKEMEIIGEAATNINKAIQEKYHQIPWTDIIGMRHRLVHAYFDINLTVLWKTIQEALPPLIEALEKILSEKPEGK